MSSQQENPEEVLSSKQKQEGTSLHNSANLSVLSRQENPEEVSSSSKQQQEAMPSSQKENPEEVSSSPKQQQEGTGLDLRTTKSFSIREYALASRGKDIFNSWPFPEKYLDMCLDRNIREVLPPFEPCGSSIESPNASSGLDCSQSDKPDGSSNVISSVGGEERIITDESILRLNEVAAEVDAKDYHDRNHVGSNAGSDCAIPTSETLSTAIPKPDQHVDQDVKPSSYPERMELKRKHKRKLIKKRSMGDILATAKPCTLEELLQTTRLSGESLKYEHDFNSTDESALLISKVLDDCFHMKQIRKAVDHLGTNSQNLGPASAYASRSHAAVKDSTL